MCEQAVAYINTTDTVMISPTSTSAELTVKSDHFYRLYPSSAKLAVAQAHYLYRVCHLKRMVVVYDSNNRAHTEVWSRIVSDEFSRMGGRVLQQIAFSSAVHPAYRHIAKQVTELRPDCVVILGNVIDNAMICQQLRAQKCFAVLSGSEWSATREMSILAGKAINGFVIVGSNDYNSKSVRFSRFVDAYNARYGRKPNLLALHAYDATKVALTAIEDSINQGKTVKDILDNRRVYDGTQREVRIDKFGDVENRARMSVVNTGEYSTVYEE
jgi:branched-chain amino acid transport system substrate-binding protein